MLPWLELGAPPEWGFNEASALQRRKRLNDTWEKIAGTEAIDALHRVARREEFAEVVATMLDVGRK